MHRCLAGFAVLFLSLTLAASCSSNKAGAPGGAGGAASIGGAGAGGFAAVGGGTGGRAGSGGTASGGSSGNGGSATDAQPGGAPGADAAVGTDAAVGAPAGCTSKLAPTLSTTVTTVSDMVLDYKLNGPSAANHYKVLLLMFDASKADASTPDVQYAYGYYTPRQLGDVFFNDANGVQAFYNEASYGKVSFSGRVVGWIDLGPQTTAATTIQQTYNTYAEKATAYATISDYDIVYFVFLTDAGDQLQVGWQTKVNTIDTSQGRAFVGVDFMINSWFFLQAGSPAYFSVILPSRSWAHELLHTLGSFGHDISLDCGKVVGAQAGAFNAYGNPFSLMGESALGNHPAISVKEYLKWTDPDQVPHVTSSGDYALCPTETVDTGKKGLVIPLRNPTKMTSTTTGTDTTFDRINVEYRRSLGFDRYEDRLQSSWLNYFKTDGPVREDGVLLTFGYQDTTTQSTVLLDMHPNSSYVADKGIEAAGNTGKFADAMLFVGESFQLPGQTTTITVKELTSDGGIRVHVEY